MSYSRTDCVKIMCDTNKLLIDNTEWVNRYKEYPIKIVSNLQRIDDALSSFNSCKGLEYYLPISKALGITKNRVYFDVRYHGQSVATIHVVNSVEVYFKSKVSNNKLSQYPEDKLSNTNTYKWVSSEGTIFRKYFEYIFNKNILPAHKAEHKLESMLLGNFAQSFSTNKHFLGIQPIMLAKQRFQMPTPIKASDAKNNKLAYSKQYGGGIDILARVGHGKGTYLSVLELKDQSVSGNKREPPEKAIKQAIAYATFIRELLRHDDTSADLWWKMFGFKEGSLPKKLTIKTVIAMPKDPNNDKSFAGEKLNFYNSDDNLELHYLYFDRNLTGTADTSL